MKMVLEGRHKFGSLTGEIHRPPPGEPQERNLKAKDYFSIHVNQQYGTTD
uniref:Uncharacterized protein n=1 Tax=Cucumis melo TaxID=3656 RepID=A0A9I9EJV6_CUCME